MKCMAKILIGSLFKTSHSISYVFTLAEIELYSIPYLKKVCWVQNNIPTPWLGSLASLSGKSWRHHCYEIRQQQILDFLPQFQGDFGNIE